jgi:rhodanese-related sulfurtransferase
MNTNSLLPWQQRFVLLMCALLSFGAAQAQSLSLTPPEAQTKLQAGELILIDIRTPEEWRDSGTAPNAQRINLQDPNGATGFAVKVLDAVHGDKTAPIAVICRTGSRSSHAQRYLVKQGFSNVFNIPEGMIGSSAGPGWIERGLPMKACSDC